MNKIVLLILIVFSAACQTYAPQMTPTAPAATLPPVSAIPISVILSPDAFTMEVASLLRRFNSQFETGPGWIHFFVEGTQRPAPGATITFPPPQYTHEQWFQIDAEGYVVGALTTDKNSAGSIVQQAAVSGSYNINLMDGSRGYYQGAPSTFKLDDITDILNYAYEKGLPVTQENAWYDGQPCLVIYLLEPLEHPMKNPGESQAFTHSAQRVWINSNTGQELHRELLWRLADGSEITDATFTYRIVEKVDSAPQEVTELVAKAATP